jgi:4-hydroxy 2-oxovalerate aldolase
VALTGETRITYLDTSLRDGSHAVDHDVSPEQVRKVVSGLAASGVRYIEVGHGAGLGGSSLLQGRGRFENVDLFDAAAKVIGESTLVTLMLPGLGVMDEIREAVEHGVGGVRVATHVTEADIAEQHLRFCRDLGLRTFGFLMMTHLAPPEVVAEQARIMEEAGAEVVYLADSAGYMTEQGVRDRVGAVRAAVRAEIGVHAHNNLGLSVANSLAAIDEGASFIDGSLGSLGAGAGNTPGEVFNVVTTRLGLDTGIDQWRLMDVAEDDVRPMMKFPQVIDRTSLVLGYAGVYSSFLHKAQAAATRYGLDPRDILLEAGRRGAVGGQEDLLEDIAYTMTRQPEQTEVGVAAG